MASSSLRAARPRLTWAAAVFRPLLCLWATAAVPAGAANLCPWMNEATASGLLGGEAIGVYVASTDGTPAMCTFTQQMGNSVRTLQVTVVVVTDPQARLAETEQTCGPDLAPLHAIGNEAIFCFGKESRIGRSVHAIGRVRNQLFEISISTTNQGDDVLTRDALKTRIYIASEQVAGNLF
jgi:hypothetical protein